MTQRILSISVLFCLLFSMTNLFASEDFPFIRKAKKKKSSSTYSLKKQMPDALLGKWWSAAKDGQVLFSKKGGQYVGKLVWTDKPYEANGQPKLDKNNPVVAMRNKSVIGMEVFKGLVYNADEKKWEGTVYDPRSGYSYSCSLWLEGNNILKVRGYLGFSLIGKTETMTRVK